MTASAPHQHAAPHTHEFDLDAGILCLDFVNTLDHRYDVVVQENLPTFAALLDFALASSVITVEDRARLEAIAADHPDEAQAIHNYARDLREAIYRIFTAIAAETQPDDADLALLGAAVADALRHGRIVRHDDAFTWVWDDASDDLVRPLWPVAWSAHQLLLGEAGDISRLRECAAHDCGWLFLDQTRNRSRRWCSMSSCGNRAKVQQFRERQRGSREQGTGNRE